MEEIKEVRQLRYQDSLTIREIAEKREISTTTVQKILKSDAVEFNYQSKNRAKKVLKKEIIEKIEEWLKEDIIKPKKRRRTARRIYQLIKIESEYNGSYESIALAVKELKNKLKLNPAKVYIPLVFAPGEAFQFDWGEVTAYINNKLEKLYIAVVVLCHSRHFYARAYLSQKQEFMLDSHQKAFKFFGGICKRGIYDNMKTAVKQILKGRHRNVQERFAKFCSYHVYNADFCSPASGNEKGRVECKVGYVNRNYFVPEIHAESIEQINEGLEKFCIEESKKTKHPDNPDKNCYEMYLEEKEYLSVIPEYEFECCRAEHTVVSPLSRVYFEWNHYSVPDEYVNKQVLVKGYAAEVSISYEGKELARHPREFGRHKFIYNPIHYLKTLERKPGALRNGVPFKDWQLPEVFEQYRNRLKEHYSDSDNYYVKILALLKEWNLEEVSAAIEQSLLIGAIGDSYILSILRNKKEPEYIEEFSVRMELKCYKAEQKTLSEYDEILKSKTESVYNEQESKNNELSEGNQTERNTESL